MSLSLFHPSKDFFSELVHVHQEPYLWKDLSVLCYLKKQSMMAENGFCFEYYFNVFLAFDL